MNTLIQEFLIVTIIVFSLNMIYFYFKNKSKKYSNTLTSEMYFLVKIYGIDINLIGRKTVEKHISILNSIIIGIDLLIYYHVESLIMALIIMFIVTNILILVLYSILYIYKKRKLRLQSSCDNN